MWYIIWGLILIWLSIAITVKVLDDRDSERARLPLWFWLMTSLIFLPIILSYAVFWFIFRLPFTKVRSLHDLSPALLFLRGKPRKYPKLTKNRRTKK